VNEPFANSMSDLLSEYRIFNTLWRAIAPIVDPHTKKKIRFLP